MSKKISIILPVYNGEKRISAAIESIINQTYTNFQLIIVNDCSQDNTLNIITDYSKRDKRILVINNEQNQKLPKSLNIGFKKAEGEYLTWTSDDNTYSRDALRTMADFLDSHPKIDMVYTDFTKFYLDGKKQMMRNNEPDDMRFINPVGPCFLYRKSLKDVIGEYDPDLFLAEDYEYWIRAYIQGNIYHYPIDLYNYGMHDKSLSSTHMIQIRKQTFLAKEKHFDELLSRCLDKKDRNRFLHEMLMLINDPKNLLYYLRLYYNIDRDFAQTDFVHIPVYLRNIIILNFIRIKKRITNTGC